jgi:hypothetical protein
VSEGFVGFWMSSADTPIPPGVDEAFIILQIGNPELDAVCDGAIEPAIRDAGFAPRRVDRHNRGDLLKSEIVQFIERSQVIVADVTNERPNCYLEIGYAMGLGKKANLILTAREDHHHTSPNFRRKGPKVHFDLEGYDILFWSADDLPTFRAELGNRIRRRSAIVRPSGSTVQAVDDLAWRDELRTRAEAGLATVGRDSYMEVAADIQPSGSWTQTRLMEVIREASIHTFGWPIAVVLENRDEFRPRPTSDGIVAEVAIGEGESSNPFNQDRRSYDFWKLFRDGRFYTLLSLFEDERRPGHMFFEVRITRVTESLLLLARVYRRLGASDTDVVTARFRHTGLAGRSLVAASPTRHLAERSSGEDIVEATVTATLAEIESDLVAQVKKVIDPLFVVYDFLELSDEVLREIVDGFVVDVR